MAQRMVLKHEHQRGSGRPVCRSWTLQGIDLPENSLNKAGVAFLCRLVSGEQHNTEEGQGP